MACSSIVALARSCGAEGVVAGLEKMYMVAFADLAPVDGGTEVFASATSGIINEIGMVATKKFVKIDLLKSTSGLEEVLTKDLSKGNSFYTQTMSLTLAGLTIENRTFIASVMNQPVSVIVKTRTGTGKYFVAGLNGQFELSALTGGTGAADADLAGYTLTFAGVSTTLVPMLDETILSTLV